MNKFLCLVALCLALLSIASAEQVLYSRCDPQWVAQLFKNPATCNNSQTLEGLNASVITLLADFAASFSISCNGVSPCNPGALASDPNMRSVDRIEAELGIDFSEAVAGSDVVIQALKEGAQALVPSMSRGGEILIVYGRTENGFQAATSRGEVTELIASDIYYSNILKRRTAVNSTA